jgi:hypothetical protein
LEIKKRAMTDAEFRALALRAPVEAVAAVSSEQLPPGFRLRFVENQGASMTIVLPDPVVAGTELTDGELEAVAGGDNRYNAIII